MLPTSFFIRSSIEFMFTHLKKSMIFAQIKYFLKNTFLFKREKLRKRFTDDLTDVKISDIICNQ